MKIIRVTDPSSEASQLRRATLIQDSFLEDAKAIMRDVSERGDPAVLSYTSSLTAQGLIHYELANKR
jgi:histidinol dehydrogenase